MQTISRRFLLILILFLLLFIPSKALASNNFSTDYHIIYSAAEDSMTHTAITITFTNLTSDYYVASYKIRLGFEHMENIGGYDSGGALTPNITDEENGKLIEVKFNNKVVGLGKKQILTLTFDTPDIAKHQGRIWEINIPGIANQDEFTTFAVDLQVPQSFGKASYIKPAQKDNSLHFTKEQLGKSGISLAFGEEQIYQFNFLYHVKNKNLFPIRTEIALPPNTNYQDVYIDSLDPEPVRMKKDTDGNWLAEYELLPGKRLDIMLKGKAVLRLEPKQEMLTDEQRKAYTQDKPYWQSANPRIVALATQLKTPQAIHEYVVKTLKYDFSRVTENKSRLGALGVLDATESAVCLEFTDLFIALARAAGIPAREVNGFAYTENTKQRPLSLVQDILHAWPEYYDYEKKAWIMIDPTWQNTTDGVDYFDKLDFDHFTFVKKGMSSTYPIPAGGYKLEGEEDKKDILVGFLETITIPDAALIMKPAVTKTFTAGLPTGGKVIIVNRGPGVSKNSVLTIISETQTPARQEYAVNELLPYQEKEINFSFDKESILTNKSDIITMALAGKQITKNMQVVPFYAQYWQFAGGILFVIFTTFIFIIAFKTGRLRLS